MSGVAAIRTAIATTLSGIANIGVVHEYERYAKNMKDLEALYAPAGALRGWFIRRETTGENSRHQGRSVEQIAWMIRGFMSLDDSTSSELTFDGLIEDIRDAFRSDETLGGVIDQTTLPSNYESGIQLVDNGPAMFANVLVHACRLRLNTVRYL